MFTPPKNAGVALFPGFWFHYFVISTGCHFKNQEILSAQSTEEKRQSSRTGRIAL